jgi:monothiol glutaredoxin
MTDTKFAQIKKDISENDIVLYMKGTAKLPHCGFSSTVAQILNRLEVTFKDIDVLTDPDLRQAIKDYTNWPTIPQLYIKGEFVGGCDIIKEMYFNGQLQELLKANNIAFNNKAA